MSAADYELLAELIAEAAVEAGTAPAISDWLRREAGRAGDQELEPLVCAFTYHLLDARNSEQRRQHGAFGPMIEWEGGQYPPPLANVPDGWLTSWAEVADRSGAPLVVSRLNDLLWDRRFGDRPDQRARRAVDAYVQLRTSVEPMVAPDALTRALDLSRALGDGARVTEIADLMADEARMALENDERQEGVTFVLIEALAELPAESRPDVLRDLLERAKTRYDDDPYTVQAAIELLVALDENTSQQDDLHAEAVARFRRAANDADGILRLAYLQQALELARKYGLREEIDQTRRELQEISADDLDLKQVKAEVTVPSEQIDRIIEEIAGGETWADCLVRLIGVYGSPSGRHDGNLAFVQELRTRSPIRFLVTSVQMGPESTLIRELRTPEDHANAALVERERWGILFFGLLAAQALARVHERLGAPSEDEIAALFDGSVIPEDLARQLAHGVVLFSEGAFDDSAHTLAPRIERGVREVCRRAGLVVSREPIGPHPGGVRSLGLLLEQLEGVLDESWRRYLVNTLTEALGVNLRNRIAHGLIGEGDAQDAALLIHVAVFLGTLRVGTQSDTP